MITTGFRTIEGNAFIGENALAKFRSRNHSIAMDDRFLCENEKEGYGYETGNRYLPYKWQDLFPHNRQKMNVRTIIMENAHVKAEFWPDYGMRLYSLIQKDDERELLYANPVLQIRNLAIRKAWFSGGIEWNFGQYGHSVTTCSPLFVSKVKGKDGEEFLRAYEYERMKGLFWHMDFHLDENDRFLWVYARFINPTDEKVPFYLIAHQSGSQNSFSEYLVDSCLIAFAFCFQGIKNILVDFDADLLLYWRDTIPFRVRFMRKPGS